MNEKIEEAISLAFSSGAVSESTVRKMVKLAYLDAAKRCADYAMDICEDESCGASSHYAACKSLESQIMSMAE